MAAETQQSQQETEETQETEQPDQEAFWTRLRDETAKVVDARLAERDKKRADGTRRSAQKRTTIPGLIADVMFGPDKK